MFQNLSQHAICEGLTKGRNSPSGWSEEWRRRASGCPCSSPRLSCPSTSSWASWRTPRQSPEVVLVTPHPHYIEEQFDVNIWLVNPDESDNLQEAGHPCEATKQPKATSLQIKNNQKAFLTNVEAKTSAQEMRPSLRASWRAHPPRSPPGGGKRLLLNQDVKCSYLHLPLWWRFHPRKGTNPHCSWRKWCSHPS